MTIEDLKNFNPLNEIDQGKVESIKAAIMAGTFESPPILIWDNEIMTGSHRVVAADQLYDRCNEISNLDDPVAEKVWEFEFKVVDISDIMEEFVAENPETEVDYSYLRTYFQGTWAEEFVVENPEW